MKDPNDTRDIDPRVGSPLWIHLMTVTAVGTVAFSLAMFHLHGVFTPSGLISAAGVLAARGADRGRRDLAHHHPRAGPARIPRSPR